MLNIGPGIQIDDSEIREEFVQSPGPGGQNVNKVATTVRLYFDAKASRALPEEVRTRLCRLAGSRLTSQGVLVLTARRFRTQQSNRRDARDRLVALIRAATVVRRSRRATTPTRASKQRRLEAKRRHAGAKQTRRFSGLQED